MDSRLAQLRCETHLPRNPGVHLKLNELSYRSIVLGITLALASPTIFAADSAGEPGRSSGKANPLKNVYFGEQKELLWGQESITSENTRPIVSRLNFIEGNGHWNERS
jgi:hypothetical protein